jgi:hypothetical protein
VPEPLAYDRVVAVLKRLAVWLLESITLDLGLGTVLLLMAVAEDPHRHLEMPVYRAILMFAAAVLVVGMFGTGYLATSAIARIFIPIKRWWFYPLTLAALFSLHLEIFFLAMGGTGWTRGEQATVRIGGACIVFLAALGGNAVLRRWSEPRPSQIPA